MKKQGKRSNIEQEMKKQKFGVSALNRRILSLLLAFGVILCLLPKTTAEAAFENTYTLTGNQRKDILGVAMTQLGYNEGPNGKIECGNDTKYGDWYGLPYNEWCAMFVSWCAWQADISAEILQRSCRAGADSKNFDIPCYSGTEYTPQPGDLYFKPDFSHVGLVYEVKGDVVVTIEGNVNYEGVSEKDGFTVAFLERKISESCFGVPAYEGCDPCAATGGEHQYLRKHDAAHPHANYFECSACGDLYYTGSHAHLTDCSSCMRCGCSTEYAGLYKVVGVSSYLTLRVGHGTDYGRRSTAELDQIVEVLAGNGRWAHIVDGPDVYYGSMAYLERYVPTPGNLMSDAKTYHEGDTAQISWGPAQTATSYRLTVKRDGQEILNQDLGDQQRYVLDALVPGQYDVSVTASYRDAVSDAGTCSFRVLALYDVAYDGRGGTNVPQLQQKIEDQTLTLSEMVPEKEGYRFLGWNNDAVANYSTYQPGDPWTANAGTTMYAIWQSESAVPESLEIVSPAQKTLYFVGDTLDTSGIELLLLYSDGSAKRMTEGYEVTGFTSEAPTEVTVTLTVEGITIGYVVKVVDTIPMYRLYNPHSGEHFYTGSAEERDLLTDGGWNYEGVAWNAPVRSGDPVYRLFYPNTGDHHYTMSLEEREWLVGLGWNYEGVAWNSAATNEVPQFRLYNPNALCGSHHYTSSTEERDWLVSENWIYEGIGWYGTQN